MFQKNDIVADKDGNRLRVVMINFPLVYCVEQHADRTDIGTKVFYDDMLTPLGYKIEK